jgi:hypothetical protein
MNDSKRNDENEPLDPARGGDPDRAVERDEGPLAPSPAIGGSGGSGSRAVVPGRDEPRERP